MAANGFVAAWTLLATVSCMYTCDHSNELPRELMFCPPYVLKVGGVDVCPIHPISGLPALTAAPVFVRSCCNHTTYTRCHLVMHHSKGRPRNGGHHTTASLVHLAVTATQPGSGPGYQPALLDPVSTISMDVTRVAARWNTPWRPLGPLGSCDVS